jgi:flagellar motor switch protein FliN/FliY
MAYKRQRDQDKKRQGNGAKARCPASRELRSEKTAAAPRDIDFLLDIPLVVTAELGRTRMLISDLLKLGQGSVIELGKMAGEPVEILVNNKLLARGDVVVVNEKFGIRLTDIISPTERVKQLK